MLSVEVWRWPDKYPRLQFGLESEITEMMRFDIVTLFPAMFSGWLGESLLGKAISQNLIQIHLHDLREWSLDRHQRVDDRPFGGGPGMVLMAEPVVRCVEEIREESDDPGTVIMLTPTGERMTQTVIENFQEQKRLILLCGRYEGFDQRVCDILKPVELSIGDYILNGGEVAAMVVVDAAIRLVPGVLGDSQSSVQDSFSSGNRMLEYPQYTRPRVFREIEVPQVLLDGDHQAIQRWRETQSRERTLLRRRDLLDDLSQQ